mmetsp:Transcript_4922/g.7602  ORF Transcript_4922/g.7602 Transcript_4922/m.7602 type:complete len:85 (+) Transcript_4922:1188-1442(+)
MGSQDGTGKATELEALVHREVEVTVFMLLLVGETAVAALVMKGKEKGESAAAAGAEAKGKVDDARAGKRKAQRDTQGVGVRLEE